MTTPKAAGGDSAASTRAVDAREVGSSAEPALRRALSNRHIQMIALGGAIGTGLFYGSADAITLAGPSILLAYLLGGVTIFFVVRAMGEMSVQSPTSGAFSAYAYRYWSPRAGFISGWNYWFNYVAVSMVELSVVGVYINYWFPTVPRWLTAALVLLIITFVNIVGVRAFGEFEFWFALIKVIAIIGMIVLGIVVIIMGTNPGAGLPAPSFSHLWNEGGFFPHGVSGMAKSLAVVMFSFGGIELIGITAGEADDPQRSIPRAINQVVYRILIFYIGALLVIMAVVPWNRIDGKLSPFVQIFDSVGIGVAAHILNLVVLTAALSVYNSALYSNGRMLYSLSWQGNAPRSFRQLSGRGVPLLGVLVSSVVTVGAVILAFAQPDTAFPVLMSTALASALINWAMILITQLKFRQSLTPKEVAQLRFKLPGGRLATAFALTMLGAVAVLMAVLPDHQVAVVVGPVWLLALFLSYEVKTRYQRARGR
ncbi:MULTISPECIES: amino acid permease [unclassified Actinobaculum]|uniref:amino acid permease n=1 Tax=unclassified Actinobaculum TaxID=2609299 RepID=UPI00196B43E1|nr:MULTISPECIES: amino acid permease [unclassified Actinobaculum]